MPAIYAARTGTMKGLAAAWQRHNLSMVGSRLRVANKQQVLGIYHSSVPFQPCQTNSNPDGGLYIDIQTVNVYIRCLLAPDR